MASPRSYASGPSHQRQWSDTSSLQGGGLPPHGHQNYPPSQSYPYNEQSPYMGPASGSLASPPPLSPTPSTASSYFNSADQRPSQRQYQRGNQYGPGSAASSVLGSATYSQYSNAPNGAGGGGGGGSRPGNNGYNSQYDQSPMMSPMSPDSWRSPPGPRGYASQNTQYSPSTQYPPPQNHPYSAASSVVNEDHGHSNRARNYPYESDSDDYYNRQGGHNAPGQGQGRYGDDRGHTLSYSTSIASNTSSVLAARRARNERNERSQRQTAAQVDEWLTSPTGTELDTEILPWSDDEAIVTKAVRSPPTGYVNEKNLPPLPYKGAPQPQPQPQPSTVTVGKMQPGRRIESDMIKVEIGGATSVIPTTEEGSGLTFVKSVPGSSSPPPGARYNPAATTPAPAIQSMTGAATSLRAAAVFTEQKSKNSPLPKQDPSRAQRPGQRLSSDWDGQRISLDDMLSASSPVPRDGRQQAIDSWRTSPPLRARDEKASFTDLKSKRRSSLPDKVVPNWNEHAQNWRSSIGQRRPSWMASSKGAHDGPDEGKSNDMDDFMAQKKKWADHGMQSSLDKNSTGGKANDLLKDDAKRLSDQSSLHRRSRSWSPRPLDKDRPATAARHRDSFASTVSRSRSRSGSRPYNRHSHRSFSRSRSRSRSIRSGRSRSGSRSRSVSLSRSRSRSPAGRGGNDLRKGDGSLAKNGQERSSSRFSWHSASDINPNRRSWESQTHEVNDGFKTSKAEGGPREAGGPRYSTAGEEDLTDYDDDFSEKKLAGRGLMGMREGKSAKAGASSLPPVETKPASLRRGKVDEDSDADSLDSPPVKVQYARRPPSVLDDDDDDDRSMTSKYPASIISTFNLPPATSPISPQKPPPLPTPLHSSEDIKKSVAAGGSVNDYMNYRPMAPPPVPDSPPQTPHAG
ncbi:hypothetical protein BGZ70_003517, partial [Mortierella alpina]